MSKLLPEAAEFSEATKVQVTPWMYGIVFIVLGIIITGTMLIGRFNEADYQRDIQNWNEKLNLVAESRKTDISNFINNNFVELRTLADNPSLKMYMTELQMAPQAAEAKDGEPSQKSYLRNLLVFTAQRAGFMTASSTDSIPANIPSESKSGLMILGQDNQLVVGTPMVNITMEKLVEHAKEQKAGEENFIDLQSDADGSLYIGFIIPVYSIQGDRNAEGQIGKIVAVKTIDENLFGLLKQPGSTEKTLENLLVNSKGEYISPLQDGSTPLTKKLEQYQKSSAEIFLTSGQGSFIANFFDYRKNPVLATVRDINGANWKLITKIDSREALTESSSRRENMVTVFTLIIAIIVLIIIAMWWYSYSRHALMSSTYFKKVAIKSKAQENLLRLVTDNQPEAIYIVDEKQTLHFANSNLAKEARMSPESIPGKSLADIRGTARADHIKEQCDNALSNSQTTYNVHHEKHGEDEIVIRSGYIPIKDIPVAYLPEKTPGVLVVEQDISDFYHERERRVSTQKQLVQTLLRLVDKRDPFAANHSYLVSEIAYRIAAEMKLDSVMTEATRTSANLMNIGKIVVPAELLTKTGQLSEEEKNTIRSSMDTAAELLEKIDFDGPVVETLKQWQEKWDGTGVLGLKGEEILISARIIAVANSFIGMISPRSWRTAMPIETANKFLLENAGSYFDNKVVIALIHYLENESGREWISNTLKSKKNVA